MEVEAARDLERIVGIAVLRVINMAVASPTTDYQLVAQNYLTSHLRSEQRYERLEMLVARVYRRLFKAEQ